MHIWSVCKVQCIKFISFFFKGYKSTIYLTENETRKIKIVNCQFLLRFFSQTPVSAWTYLQKMIKSCVKIDNHNNRHDSKLGPPLLFCHKKEDKLPCPSHDSIKALIKKKKQDKGKVVYIDLFKLIDAGNLCTILSFSNLLPRETCTLNTTCNR